MCNIDPVLIKLMSNVLGRSSTGCDICQNYSMSTEKPNPQAASTMVTAKDLKIMSGVWD